MLRDFLTYSTQLLFLQVQWPFDLVIARKTLLLLLDQQLLQALGTGLLLGDLVDDISFQFLLPEDTLVRRIEV